MKTFIFIIKICDYTMLDMIDRGSQFIYLKANFFFQNLIGKCGYHGPGLGFPSQSAQPNGPDGTMS